MTTAVYIRGRHLAADTKSCGGHTGINYDVEKIFSTQHDGISYHLVFAGIKMLDGLVIDLFRKHVILREALVSFDQAIYHFKDDIKTHAGDRFEGIIIAKCNPQNLNQVPTRAYKINETNVEDVHTSCTIGSGGDIAMGILLRDPETPLEDLYRLVSTKDSYTGEKFICIDLSK